MKLRYLLPLLIFASCAHRQVSRVGVGSKPSTVGQQDAKPIPFELGLSEFQNGDAIAITEVSGTDSTFAIGTSYVVRGHYHLMSRDNAMLLLSVTAIDTSGSSPIDAQSKLEVNRGDGDFILRGQITYGGYPHVTFYGSDGMPIGGVYFGNGRFLFKR